MMRHPEGTRQLKVKKLAGEEGFEPSLRDPESRVLPLDDSPATDVIESDGACAPLQSKSRRFAPRGNGLLPSALPQKTTKVGLL